MDQASSATPPLNGFINWKLLIVSTVLSFLVLFSFVTLSETVLKVDSYYVYYGSTGPYNVIVPQDIPDGEVRKSQLKLGEKSNYFHAGDWIGWTSNTSVEAGVKITSSILLYNKDLNANMGLDEATSRPGEIRTGERYAYFKLPNNIPPGNYELKRKLIFTPHFGVPVSANFNSIPFEVIK